VTFRSGTAYGLESRADHDWRTFGACLTAPDLFFPDMRTAPTEVRAAKHLCRTRCTVLDKCTKFATDNPPQAGVLAGWTSNEWKALSAGRPICSGCNERVSKRGLDICGHCSSARSRRKTHCKRNHELSGANVRVSAGKRSCRACVRTRGAVKPC
jgi:hypothetical protein